MITWEVETFVAGLGTRLVNVSAIARGTAGARAIASAETCIIDAHENYGVPADVPQDQVMRFSRVKADPVDSGGGSEVLKASLAEMDRHGFWSVLECNPYPGHSKRKTRAFYVKHGFMHRPGLDPDALYRPPAASVR